MEKKQNKKVILGVVAFLAVAVILGAVYYFTRPETSKGAKEVEITVVNAEGEKEEYKINTDAEYLQQAMDDAKEEGLTYSGTEGEYGLMVDTVNGEKANFDENGAYWGFFVNGEYCNYGIAEQPVADKDSFEIVYTLGEQKARQGIENKGHCSVWLVSSNCVCTTGGIWIFAEYRTGDDSHNRIYFST